ncbi:hypothetical protein GCM10010452_77660 [Crossiella cryophila]
MGVLAAAALLTGLAAGPAVASTEPVLHLPTIYLGSEHIPLNVVCPEQDWQPVRSTLFTEPVRLASYPANPTWGFGTGYLAKGLTAGSTHAVSFGCGAVSRTLRVTVQPPETIGQARLQVSPSAGRVGDKVKVVRTCYKANKPNTVPVSAALEPMTHWTGTASEQTFETKVRAGVKPGRYQVSFRCGGTGRTVFFIVEAPPGQQPPPPVNGGQVRIKPVGGVETGGGEPA